MSTTPQFDASGFVQVELHPRAQCEDCGWTQRKATANICRQHVRDTGHTVYRVTETRASYYPKGEYS